MTYDPYGRPAGRPDQPAGRHNRRSIRLKGYDYSQAGAYFITIVTQDRASLFGAVVDGEMRLNELGEIVRDEWFRSAEIRREIELNPDEFVVMPNHIHGIVWIVDDDAAVGATGRSPQPPTTNGPSQPPTTNGPSQPPATGSSLPPTGPAPRSLSSFVAGFKSAVTKRINHHRDMPSAPVWQRNYYEHIIRNERALNAIRQYIADNPRRWTLDREHPVTTKPKPERR